MLFVKCKALFRQQSSVLSGREKGEESLGRNRLTKRGGGREPEDRFGEVKETWGHMMSRHPPGP